MRPTKCKSCGLTVVWTLQKDPATNKERWYCFNNGTNTDHWDLCSKTRFEKIKRTGDPFDHGDERGYYTELKPSGVQFTFQKAVVRGVNYSHSEDCENCVPPWERCEKCPDKLELRK